jgi:hypothetical protein
MEVADRKLVRHSDGHFSIVPVGRVLPTDTALVNRLQPIVVTVADDGLFTTTPTGSKSSFRLYDRGDPSLNEKALQQAVPEMYLSFHP